MATLKVFRIRTPWEGSRLYLAQTMAEAVVKAAKVAKKNKISVKDAMPDYIEDLGPAPS
jgi:hypothetical protein